MVVPEYVPLTDIPWNIPVVVPATVSLPRGLPAHRNPTSAFVEVPGKDGAVIQVDMRRYDIGFGAEGREDLFGRLPIVEGECSRAVSPDDLRDGRELVDHPAAERQEIVRYVQHGS